MDIGLDISKASFILNFLREVVLSPFYGQKKTDARADWASFPRARTLTRVPMIGAVTSLICRGSGKCLLKGSRVTAGREENMEEVGTRASR